VQFEIDFPTAFAAHCHCSMCRHGHGAAYVTWFGVPEAQLRVTTGEQQLVHYPSSEHGSRSFCGRCGSTLFCRLETHAGIVDVTLANLLDPLDREPSMHVFFSDGAAWTKVGDELPRLGGKTGLEPLAPAASAKGPQSRSGT
jgi:hypothetical protein